MRGAISSAEPIGNRTDDADLARVVSRQRSLDVADLREANPDAAALSTIPEDLARRLTALPIEMVGETVVFAVSERACVISSERRHELQKYITGIVTRQAQKLIAIYCMPDHTHVFLGLKASIAPSDLIGDIKTGSTNHQRAELDRLPIFLAGRLRCVFRFAFPPRACGQLHPKSKRASSPKIVSTRIHGISGAPSCCVR